MDDKIRLEVITSIFKYYIRRVEPAENGEVFIIKLSPQELRYIREQLAMDDFGNGIAL